VPVGELRRLLERGRHARIERRKLRGVAPTACRFRCKPGRQSDSFTGTLASGTSSAGRIGMPAAA
jgi:hypothetical protein